MKLENYKIIHISEETTIWQKQLPKISFVVEDNAYTEYPKSIVIDLIGGKTEMIKSLKVGDIVDVYLSTRAKEYEWKWFNNISAWKIWVIKASPLSGEDLPF
jgi:hypothetical protein